MLLSLHDFQVLHVPGFLHVNPYNYFSYKHNIGKTQNRKTHDAKSCMHGYTYWTGKFTLNRETESRGSNSPEAWWQIPGEGFHTGPGLGRGCTSWWSARLRQAALGRGWTTGLPRGRPGSLRVVLGNQWVGPDSQLVGLDSQRAEVDSRWVEVDSRWVEVGSQWVETDSQMVRRGQPCQVYQQVQKP